MKNQIKQLESGFTKDSIEKQLFDLISKNPSELNKKIKTFNSIGDYISKPISFCSMKVSDQIRGCFIYKKLIKDSAEQGRKIALEIRASHSKSFILDTVIKRSTLTFRPED